MAKRSVTILDHRINNLANIVNAFKALGVEVDVAEKPEQLRDAGHVVLPGVGAFGASMDALETKGLDAALYEHVRAGKPLLGICLGYQVLFDKGNEGGGRTGLGFIPGYSKRFERGLPIPHVGWNQLEIVQEHPAIMGMRNGAYAYFTHSYHTVDVPEENVLLCADYGGSFVCGATKDNVLGVQFHPETSGASGLRLLLHYVDWRP